MRGRRPGSRLASGRLQPWLAACLGLWLACVQPASVSRADETVKVRPVDVSWNGHTPRVSFSAKAFVSPGVREKLKYSDVPAGLQGLGIAFITVGLMSLGFMSFGGIDL